jgi:hypothetical protein
MGLSKAAAPWLHPYLPPTQKGDQNMVTDDPVRGGGEKVPNVCFWGAGLVSDRLRGL